MKCPNCQTDLFVGSRFCSSCGKRLDQPSPDGPCMSRNEFFCLALPQRFQSFLHTGIFLTYFCALLCLISSIWHPVSGFLQAILCLVFAIGLQASKSLIWALTEIVLTTVCLVVGLVIDGSFISLLAMVAGVFACIGSHALSAFYTAYVVGGKTPELRDEEGRLMALKYKKRKNFCLIAGLCLCVLMGIILSVSIAVHLSGSREDEGYTTGTIAEDGSYENSFAGIRLTPDEEWTVYSGLALDDVRREFNAGGADSMVYYAANETLNASVRLDLVKQSTSIITEKDLLDSYVSQGLADAESQNIVYRYREYTTVTLNGEDYLCLDAGYSEEGSTESIYEYILCRQIGTYSVIFTVYSESEEAFDSFLEWFK
ncbi:MAG: hypothetical protein ACI3YK_08025 [Eubacteriales bacterium]